MGERGRSYAFPKCRGCFQVSRAFIKNGRCRIRPWLISLTAVIVAAVAVTVPGAWAPVGAASGEYDWTPGMACEGAPMLGVLRPSMESNVVWEVRQRLHRLGFAVGPLDEERYDEALLAAVRAFQSQSGLVADGIVGPQTWAALAEGEDFTVSAPQTPAPTGEITILIDTERLTLTVLSDGEPYKTYPVAVGRPKSTTLTPIGEWRVVHKGLNWGGGFGTRWLGLNVPWGIYGIHGTNNPGAIGTRASAGCIRMFNRDVEELYEWVPLGTPVIISGVRRPVAFNRTLTTGSQGPDVVEVQLRLNEFGFDVGDADGRYGPRTEAAVRRLQRVFGLPQDGRVWADVYYVLGLK